MRQRSLPSTEEHEFPHRRLRLVIEDRDLAGDGQLGEDLALAFDVSVCSGPGSDREVCPLVTEGRCPLAPCDVVVSAVDGPWSRAVRAAWRQAGVPLVEAPEIRTTDAGVRLDRAVASAIAAVVPAGPPVGSA